jgi:hypothetical protein
VVGWLGARDEQTLGLSPCLSRLDLVALLLWIESSFMDEPPPLASAEYVLLFQAPLFHPASGEHDDGWSHGGPAAPAGGD